MTDAEVLDKAAQILRGRMRKRSMLFEAFCRVLNSTAAKIRAEENSPDSTEKVSRAEVGEAMEGRAGSNAIWTDEAVAAALQERGVHLQTPAERAKWMKHYRELDALVMGAAESIATATKRKD